MIRSVAECRGIAHSLNSHVHLAELSTLHQRRQQSDTNTPLSVVCDLLPLLTPFPHGAEQAEHTYTVQPLRRTASMALVGDLAVPLSC